MLAPMERGLAGDTPALRPEPWQRLEAGPGGDELGLPPGTQALLEDIPARFSERFWSSAEPGSGRPGASRRGLLVLFSGPSGSGKTRAAQALAHELHLPIWRADIESYFTHGRTEGMQTLTRLFAAAQRSGAVLLLDGAATVLAGAEERPRGAGAPFDSDARELLRRSEAHPGVVVFTVADARRLGPATRERFDHVVDFGPPGRAAEGWRAGESPEPAAGVRPAEPAEPAEPAGGRRPAGDAGAWGWPPRGDEVTPAVGAAEPPAPAPPPPPPPPPAGAGVEPQQPARTAATGSTSATGFTSATGSTGVTGSTAAPGSAEPLGAQRPPAPLASRHATIRAPVTERGRSPRALVALAVVGGILAVVLGLVLARNHGTSTPQVSLDRTAAAGPIRFAYPPSWRHAAMPSLSGLSLSDGIALTASGKPSGTLVIGTASTSQAAPVPSQFVAANLTGSPAPQAVTLGGHRFYRVLDPRLGAGAPSHTVYALPDGAGTVVAVCETSTQAFVAACERVLATLQAIPIPSRAPVPDAAYAHALNGVLSQLVAARTKDAAALAAARDAAGQAKAAAALATDHATAATALEKLSAGSAASANAGLIKALQSTSAGYTALSRAAAHGNTGAYGAAKRLVDGDNAALGAALAHLKTLGYTVG